VVLAESHLAIHTWPERNGATLDVYVCNYTSDNTRKAEAVYAALIKAFKPGDVMVERVMRGRDLPLKKRVA
jgi:S-adenosylmethionine/arginine decarboxylase-like enzyme